MFGAGVAYIVVFGLFLAGRTATAIGEGGPDGSDPSAVIGHRDVAVQPGAATGPLRRSGRGTRATLATVSWRRCQLTAATGGGTYPRSPHARVVGS